MFEKKIARVVKPKCSNSFLFIRLITTDWIECVTDLRQGDSLSPNSFSVFTKDPVAVIYDLGRLSGFVIVLETWSFPYFCTLIILCLTQKVKTTFNWCLDTVNGWRSPWHVIVNANKSKHFFFEVPKRKDAICFRHWKMLLYTSVSGFYFSFMY